MKTNNNTLQCVTLYNGLTIKFFSREVSFLLRQRSIMTLFPEVVMYGTAAAHQLHDA